MDNISLKKLCRNIDYNAYNNIKNILLATGGGVNLAATLTANETARNCMFAYSLSAITLSLIMFQTKGERYTKEMWEIGKEYQEFINDYNLLNDAFSLNNHIEISTMFQEMLYNGYLSKDKSFKWSNECAKDIYNMEGTDIFKGQAVCRHISSMLTDVLNNYGIYSNLVSVYNPETSTDDFVEYMLKFSESINKLYSKYNGKISNEEFEELLRNMVIPNGDTNPDIEMIDTRARKYQRDGNHAISFAFKDGISYYLDPTNHRNFRLSRKFPNMLYDELGKCLIKESSTKIINHGDKYYDAIIDKVNADKFNFISLEEENDMIFKTKKLFHNNLDVIELFYNNNKDRYNEISNKILKMNTHMPNVRSKRNQ